MGRVVTYAIGFAKRSPFAEEIKQRIQEYQTFSSLNKPIEAAKTAVQIADLLYEQCDELDPKLSEEERKRDENNSLTKALRYGQKALKVFAEADNKEEQARVLIILSKCHQRLFQYDFAVSRIKRAITLFKEYKEADKLTRQSAFKLAGDIYFFKGLDAEQARCDDFQNALKYYKKESALLQVMTVADVDNDPTVLPVLKQSSLFNIGVVESKLPDYKETTPKPLVKALKIAKELKDYESQKQTLWELAKIYAKKGNYEMVEKCQAQEYYATLKLESKDDEIICFIERIKTHLEREEFEKCRVLCKAMRECIDSEDETICDETSEMITVIKELKDDIRRTARLVKSTPVIFQRAKLHLKLAQTQFDYEMYRAAYKTLTSGLEDFTIIGDEGILCILYTELLELKATIQWELRESELKDYLNLNDHLLSYIKNNIKKIKMKLDYSIQVYERLVAIYKYYKETRESESWETILLCAQEEFKQMEKMGERGDDPMDIDLVDLNDDDLRLESLNMSSQLLGSKITAGQNVRIRVLLPEPVMLLIPVHYPHITILKLMDEVSKRTWTIHGIEPKIGHLSIGETDFSPQDIFADVIKNPDDIIEAHVKGTVDRSPLDCYENACHRLKVSVSPLITSRLNQQRTGALNLSGLEITKGQVLVIRELLLLMPYIHRLDLSCNLLFDNHLVLLLEGIKCPRELVLSNNRLTATCLSSLSKMKTQTLRSLNLSYNPLGSEILIELPSLFNTFKVLENLEIEGTGLGTQLDLNSHLTVQYTDFNSQNNQANIANRKVCINIRNNHFQANMLSEWTSRWETLPGIEELQLSGVTSDERWDGFQRLSNFKWLKSLDFSRTVKGVLSIPDLRDILMMGANLTNLDLSYCNLITNDIYILCEGLEFNRDLQTLILRSNPELGDEAIQQLQYTLLQDDHTLATLDISDCGLTNDSIENIIRWVGSSHFKEINVSENPLLIQNRHQLEYFIQRYLEKNILIPFRISLEKNISLNDLDIPTGLIIQTNAMTTSNPFS